MRTFTHFLTALVLSSVISSAQESEHTQRLFNDITYQVFVKRSLLPDKQASRTNFGTGTFWATKIDGSNVLITAAHNLGLGPNSVPNQIDEFKIENETKLLSISSRPNLGSLAYEIGAVGFLEGAGDVVLMQPSDQDVFNWSTNVKLAEKPPKLGDRVTVYGFPGTVHEKAKESKIAAMNQSFFVINDELEKGYSGGVVLNEQQEAVGVVITTQAKQANAILLSNELFSKVEWKPFKEVQSRKIEAN